MRTVADLAGVSVQQASVVLGDLARLGVVERRDVPPSSLVRLSATNLVAETIRSLGDLRSQAIEWMKDRARSIRPVPTALVLFGSFARGEARADSDVDVLVVRPAGLDGSNEARWYSALGAWQDGVARALGNPVNVVEVDREDVRSKLAGQRRSMWQEAVADGISLLGPPIQELMGVVTRG